MLTTALCVSQLPPFSWLSGFGLEAVSSAISRSFGNITFKLQVLTETYPIPLPRAVQQHWLLPPPKQPPMKWGTRGMVELRLIASVPPGQRQIRLTAR